MRRGWKRTWPAEFRRLGNMPLISTDSRGASLCEQDGAGGGDGGGGDLINSCLERSPAKTQTLPLFSELSDIPAMPLSFPKFPEMAS